MNKIEKRFCKECGGEIVFEIVSPRKKYFISDEKNLFIRDTSEDNIIFNKDESRFMFYCNNNSKHKIEGSDNFDGWMEYIIKIFEVAEFNKLIEKFNISRTERS